MKTAVILTWCVVLSLLAGCAPDLASDIRVEVVQRVSSPDGRVEALLQLVDGGVTTSKGYAVFIVPAGSEPKDDFRMGSYEAPSKYEISLRWLDATSVEVVFESARSKYINRSTVVIDGITYQMRDGGTIDTK